MHTLNIYCKYIIIYFLGYSISGVMCLNHVFSCLKFCLFVLIILPPDRSATAYIRTILTTIFISPIQTSSYSQMSFTFSTYTYIDIELEAQVSGIYAVRIKLYIWTCISSCLKLCQIDSHSLIRAV